MAQLSPLIQFTAGTPAVAADVNSNFADIRNHINSASIDTENIAPTLTSRAGGPILFLNQSSQNEIVFSIQNSQPNTGMYILQSTTLADATKAVVKIEDSVTQLAASNNGKAELWLSLAGGSTIPALLVEHGANTSMSLTKTQLNLFNSAIQATSSGSLTLSGPFTANGLIQTTAPVGDAIAIKVKGRSSDNNAIVQFKSNNDATIYASATSSASGLTLNLPDTADNYTFQMNGVTKAVINNDGIDGQYLKSNSVTTTKILDANVTPAKRTAGAFSEYITGSLTFGPYGPGYVVYLINLTLTTTGPNKVVAITIGPRTFSGTFYQAGTSNPSIQVLAPGGALYTTLYGFGTNWSGDFNGANQTYFINCTTQGTYTLRYAIGAFGGSGNTFYCVDMGFTMAEIG